VSLTGGKKRANIRLARFFPTTPGVFNVKKLLYFGGAVAVVVVGIWVASSGYIPNPIAKKA
jgi:hypothetical protein